MAIYKDEKAQTKDKKKWYKSKKYSSKTETERAEATFRLNVGSVVSSAHTFNSLFDDYLNYKKDKVRPQTIMRDKKLFKHISPAPGNVNPEHLTLAQYKNWQNELNKKNLKASYKNRMHKFVLILTKHADRFYNINTKVPIIVGGFKDPLEKQEEMDFYTYDEYQHFISCVDDFLYKAVFDILYYCGLRQGELQALTWHDIDFQKNTISINKTLTTKIKGQKYTVFPPKTKNSYRYRPMAEIVKGDLLKLSEIARTLDGYNKE